MDKYADEIEGYENTSVRYVKVPYSYDFSRQKEDIRPVTWRPMTTENVKDFFCDMLFLFPVAGRKD